MNKSSITLSLSLCLMSALSFSQGSITTKPSSNESINTKEEKIKIDLISGDIEKYLTRKISFSDTVRGDLSDSAWYHYAREVKYVLNGQEIDSRMLGLISVKNISEIDVIKSTEPAEIRIITRKDIEYMDYNALKVRAKVSQDENPSVIVDFTKIENEKSMKIDKDLIKKIRIDNQVIEIRTPSYRKEKKQQGTQRVVIR